jgi:hypothetical protein
MSTTLSLKLFYPQNFGYKQFSFFLSYIYIFDFVHQKYEKIVIFLMHGMNASQK